ncbi:thiamine phosphate synthase [Vibrio salinus]|uniref:thiamine phosphate synthase n=1 Tax=Vibrio salinus TaxID=2899784 RepID=UPI001E5D7ED3|nr:thiamine phosphate synthase [Vibrio salinus]MCE0496187.1 thiamine phosphate synthase [Vibrio salinus]
MKTPNYQLYLVTDEKLDEQRLCHVIEQSVCGGVSIIQLREKHQNTRQFIRKASAVKDLLKSMEIPLIINDRIDVALAVNADGVHLGQSDMPVDIARKILGPDKIIGLSVESHEQLIFANHLDIDYIGLSAIYNTATKTDIRFEWKQEGLEWAIQHTQHPIVAIGGINQETLPAIAKIGVDGVAIVSAICQSENPKKAASELLAAFHSSQYVPA